MNVFYDWEFDESPDRLLPISLGMVNESGDALYLINKDADLESCNPWVKQFVVPHLGSGDRVSLADMREAVLKFCEPKVNDVHLFGYYCAYDHVLLSRLFGAMEKMPLPYYTTDIKVLMDIYNVDVGSGDDRHNALSDALWIRKAYAEIVKSVTFLKYSQSESEVGRGS